MSLFPRLGRGQLVAWVSLAGLVVAAYAAARTLRGLPDQGAVGDAAIAEFYVLHAVRGIWPLGPYSQYFWHHPGPAMFYALVPLYLAGGQHPAALGLGGALINLAAVAGSMGLVARRLPAVATAAVGLSLVVWIVRTGPLLASYWNAHLIVLPLLLTFWLAVAIAGGSSWLMPVLVVVGAFVAQTHVGTLPIVAALSILAVAAGARQPSTPRRRALHLSAWVLAACWALPIADQLIGTPGNLGQLASYFWERRHEHQPFLAALDAWAVALGGAFVPQFRVPVGWGLSGAIHPIAIAAAIAQLSGLIVLARRERADHRWSTTAAFAAITQGLALVAISRIPGEVHDHAVFWVGVLGHVGWGLLVGWLASRAARSLAPMVAEPAVRWRAASPLAAIAVVLAFAAAAASRTVVPESDRHPPDRDMVLMLYEGVLHGLEAERVATPLVRIDEPVWREAAGVLLQMYRHRLPFAVERRWVHMYGPPLAATGCGYSHVLYIAPVGARSNGERVAQAGSVEARLQPLPACPTIDP